MSAPSRLGQGEIALFFFPLLLNVQLMSVSHSVINAFLARQNDYVTALAGFSVAMVLHLFLASPSYQNHTVTIAMVRGRRSLRGTVRFVVLVACYVSVMLALVAFTPVGDFVLKRFLGVNNAIAAAARSALSLLVALPFITGFRGLFQGLVIKARRTTLVSVATAVRIGALLIFVAVGARWFSGARLGAFALLACVATETALIGAFAWGCELAADDSAEKGTWEILRFAFPLAYSSCLQQTIPLLINAVISRFPDGPQALAGFGVIRGLLFLLAGPMRNLQQAYLTLVQSAADFSPLVHFGKRVALGLALLLVVTAWPLNRVVLGDIMGLDAPMRAYLSLPLAACALYPLFYGGSNLLRGWFTGHHRTALLGRSTIYKTGYLLAAWALLTAFPLPLPGVAVAIFLLLSAELCEAVYLYRQRLRLLSPCPAA
jgi:progressive ankylosis protein